MNSSDLKHKRSFIKKVGIISIITMVSRILGLVRDLVRARLLGTSFYSDAFTLAFSLPNLFRRLTAEGVMINAFIPVFCRVQKEDGDRAALGFSASFFWMATIILTLFSALFILASPWLVKYVFAPGFENEALDLTVFLTQFMFVYIVFISLAAVGQGVLNSFSTFWVSAATPVLLNISIISFALFLFKRFENPTVGFAIGVVAGGAAQMAFHFPFLKKKGFKLFKDINLSGPAIKETFKLVVPTMFGVGIYQINIIVSNLIATMTGEGAISSLNYSNRLLEMFLGVFVISIVTVILPRFSVLILERNYDQVKEDLNFSMRLTAFISLPIMTCTILLAKDIVSLLYERGAFDANSVAMTAGALKYHMIGLLFISWNRILSTGYQAARFLKRMVQISFFVMIVNIVCAVMLSQVMQHKGIAFANSISQIVQTILLIYFIKEIGISGLINTGWIVRFIKILVCCSVMGGCVFYFDKYLKTGGAVSLFVTVPADVSAGVISYAAAAYILKCSELKEMMMLVLKRKKKIR